MEKIVGMIWLPDVSRELKPGEWYRASEVDTMTDGDLPPIQRTHALLWQSKYFEALVELRKANKGAARLRRRLDRFERLLDVERRAVAAAHQHADIAVRWEAEANEQARLNGMGSEREATLKARLAELERVLLNARVLMRDLWRLDPIELPSDDLAQRCKAFMGGG